MPDSYVYGPLQGHEIRLIRLHNDPRGRELNEIASADMHHVPLDQAPPFLAVSYVWQDESCRPAAPSQPLMRIDGQNFQLSPSLWRAIFTLGQWRFSASHTAAYSREVERVFGRQIPDFLWADAVCIDQNNGEEKACQVPRMTAIYKSASVVFGFLGMDRVKSHTRLIGELSDKCEELMSVFHSRRGRGMTSESDFSLASFFGERMKAMLHAFHYVISSPWFSRVWIIQEVAAAAHWPVLGHGKALIRFQPLALLASMLHYRYLDMGLAHFDSDNVLRLKTLCSIRSWQEPASGSKTRKYRGAHSALRGTDADERQIARELEELIAPMTIMYRWSRGQGNSSIASRLNVALFLSSRAMMASERPHDMIYGVLGLATQLPLPLSLRPNYDMEYPKVCQAYAQFIAQHSGSLWILGYMRKFRFSDFDLAGMNMPSWVPDFRTQTFYNQISQSSGLTPPNKGCISFLSDGAIMQVRGSSLGSGQIIRIWRGDQPVQDWREDRPVTKGAFAAFHNDMLVASAQRMNVSEDAATDLWLLGHLRARHGTLSPLYDEGHITRAVPIVRAVWQSLLKETAAVTITWRMKELLGHELSMETSEVIFKITSQVMNYNSALTENGTIWLILSEAEEDLVKLGDLPTVIDGFSYDNDTLHEMAVVLRPSQDAFKVIGFAEANRRKTSPDSVDWVATNIA